MLSASSGATVRSVPSTGACGVAAFAPAGRADGLGTVSRHAQGREQALADEGFPGLAAHLGHDLAGHDVEDVVVGVAAAEARRRLQEADLLDDLAAREGRGRKVQEVAFAQAQPAAVGEQIADGHLLRDVGVVHPERREMTGDGIVPPELAVFDEQAQGGRGERLGVGGDGEEGIAVDGSGGALATHAVALGQHHAAVLHHRHRDAGDLELPPRALDVGVDRGQGRGHGRGRRPGRDRGHEQHRGHDGKEGGRSHRARIIAHAREKPRERAAGQDRAAATPMGQETPVPPWPQYPSGFLARYCWWYSSAK